jgi:hypothetical protein
MSVCTLKIGDTVLGVGATGLALTKVIYFSKMSRLKKDKIIPRKWLHIIATSDTSILPVRHAHVICTPEHQFYNPVLCTYIEAEMLMWGMKLCVAVYDKHTDIYHLKEYTLMHRADVTMVTRSIKYNIVTETENYFVGGMLVQSIMGRDTL